MHGRFVPSRIDLDNYRIAIVKRRHHSGNVESTSINAKRSSIDALDHSPDSSVAG